MDDESPKRSEQHTVSALHDQPVRSVATSGSEPPPAMAAVAGYRHGAPVAEPTAWVAVGTMAVAVAALSAGTDHRHTVASSPQEANSVSDRAATDVTLWLWPVPVATVRPVANSVTCTNGTGKVSSGSCRASRRIDAPTLTTPSSPPDSRSLPEGVKATVLTPAAWRRSVEAASSEPVPPTNDRIVPSRHAAARLQEAGEAPGANAAAIM